MNESRLSKKYFSLSLFLSNVYMFFSYLRPSFIIHGVFTAVDLPSQISSLYLLPFSPGSSNLPTGASEMLEFPLISLDVGDEGAFYAAAQADVKFISLLATVEIWLRKLYINKRKINTTHDSAQGKRASLLQLSWKHAAHKQRRKTATQARDV